MAAVTPWPALDAIDADPATRARWLEKALMGTTLADVISQLAALRGGGPVLHDMSPQVVRDWLGDEAELVLEHGLTRLSRSRLDELLTRPALLAGLQELVLSEGGSHWERLLAADASLDELARRQRRAAGDPPAAPVKLVAVTRPAGWSGPRLAALLVPLAAAAAVLVWLVPAFQPRQPGPGKEGVATVKGAVPDSTAPPDAGPPKGPAGAGGPTTVVVGTDPASPAVSDDGVPASGPTWPTHPWQQLDSRTVGKRPDQPGVLAVGSRQWSRQLRDADGLSPAQVMAAARQAQGGIKAIDGLVANQGLRLEEDRATQVQRRCRQALDRIDQLRSSPELHQGDAEAVANAKADIVRAVEEVEQALEAATDVDGGSRPRP